MQSVLFLVAQAGWCAAAGNTCVPGHCDDNEYEAPTLLCTNSSQCPETFTCNTSYYCAYEPAPAWVARATGIVGTAVIIMLALLAASPIVPASKS